MKNLNKFLVLIIWLLDFTTIAQNADSVIVIYDNQKTVIPVPAFGSLTTVKYSDSIQVIEIGVSRQKPNDNHSLRLTPLNSALIANLQRTRKWFSQVEVGYSLGFVRSKGLYYPVDSLDKTTYQVNKNKPMGYILGLSVCDKERVLNNNYSYISGFKFGYSQYFRAANPLPVTNDTNIVFYGYDALKENHFKFLVPFGLRYHLLNGKSDAQINFGANMGYLISVYKHWANNNTYGDASAVLMVNPFIELQIKQFGFQFSTELFVPEPTQIMKSSMDFTLTYRFY
ncbi:MAG: hypothetical protein ACOYN4_09310 [Bacteroidales bacterium]